MVNTGDPLPEGPVADGDCPAGDARWLGFDPHVPFAVTSRGEIETAGVACCAPWAVRGARWQAIDRWGRVVGLAEVSGGEGYDLTQCYELVLRKVEGEDGVGLFVSPGWTSPPSAEWTPQPAERASLATLVAHADALFPPRMDDGPLAPIADRTLFFQAAPNEGNPEDPTRFAVVGGRVLVVAGKTEPGAWALSHFDSKMAETGYSPPDAYRPLAVVDVDGDGWPEIVFRESDGPSWGDVILRMQPDSTGRPWERVAESVGGSTA